MNSVNPWKSYRQVATQTASPGQLVLMLYDGAIRFLERALIGFSKEDPAEFNETVSNNVMRAQEIINELNYSLNLELGGEIAKRLRQLYLYFDRRLTESNLAKEPSGIKEVISRVSSLREAWAIILSGQDAVDAAAAAAQTPQFTDQLAVA